MSMPHMTRGRIFHPQLTVPFAHAAGESLAQAAHGEDARFAIVLVRAGSGLASFGQQALPVVAPAVLLLDEALRPVFRQSHRLQLDTLYFHPGYINSSFEVAALHDEVQRRRWTGSTKQDFFLLERFVKLPALQRVVNLPSHIAARLVGMFDECVAQAMEQPDKFWPCRTRSYLIELLFQLRLLQAEPLTTPVALPDLDDARSRRIGHALRYVQESFQRELTLGELARECATNRTTLNAEFRAATGMTVRAYTIALRMKMAAALLRDTKIPVGEVMARVGYGNQSHFTRAFRQTLGESPRAYRDKHCIL